jgi:peptide/nickel transport system permease protein
VIREGRAWRTVRRSTFAWVGAGIASALVLAALAADLIASDLPIAVRVHGQSFWLPSLTRPDGLRGHSLANLRAEVRGEPGGWIVEPAVPFGPNQIALEDALQPPGAGHPLGTDELGRDVLARLVHGARASLAVGVLSVLLYVAVGILVGACAGYYGGRVDATLSRATEVMLSFPTVFLVLCVLGVTRARGLVPIILVIGLTRWTDVSRLVRAEVLRLRELDFVHASRALGGGGPWIVTRHLVPHATGPVLVAATFGVAGAILLETALSFLGLGIQPPAPSWGELLTQAHRYVTYPGAWWLTLFPGLAIFLTVASFNLVGEALRDAASSPDL